MMIEGSLLFLAGKVTQFLQEHPKRGFSLAEISNGIATDEAAADEVLELLSVMGTVSKVHTLSGGYRYSLVERT